MVIYRYLSFGQAESGLNLVGKDRTAQHVCCDNRLYTRGDFSVKPHPVFLFFCRVHFGQEEARGWGGQPLAGSN